jgi:putative copper export protein
MMNYVGRALAVSYLLGFAVWAASIVGQPSSCQPATWSAAFKFVFVIAVGMWFGWQACYEAAQAKAEQRSKATGGEQ